MRQAAWVALAEEAAKRVGSPGKGLVADKADTVAVVAQGGRVASEAKVAERMAEVELMVAGTVAGAVVEMVETAE